MVPLGMRRCLMAIAAVVAFFATQHAFAADQCVAELASLPDAASLGVALGGDAPEVLSGEAAVPDDALLIEGDKVPISLPIGASAIAPRLLRAIGDASIEAERACHGPLAGAHGTIHQDDRHDRAEPPLAGDACLPVVEPLAPAVEARVLSLSPPATTPARGVRSPVDRPPRR
jgi:hypothetical protein